MSLLLKPQSPSIAIFLIASEEGIATSETHKPTQQLHTVYPQDTASWLLGPVLMVAIHLIS
jgi:hypothetical protein